jgi:hypothetical protein
MAYVLKEQAELERLLVEPEPPGPRQFAGAMEELHEECGLANRVASDDHIEIVELEGLGARQVS